MHAGCQGLHGSELFTVTCSDANLFMHLIGLKLSKCVCAEIRRFKYLQVMCEALFVCILTCVVEVVQLVIITS